MGKLVFLILLIPSFVQAQNFQRKRIPIVVSVYDSVAMQYSLYSRSYNDGNTLSYKVATFKNGNWLSFPHDTLQFTKYIGRSHGSIDSIAHFRNGNLLLSPKSQLTLPYTQISGRPSLATVATSGSYPDLVNKPTIPTMFPDSVQYYNSSGRIYNKIKKWVGRVAVTNASGQSVDISACGCSSILSIVATAEKNGTTSTASPNVSIKSYTTSAVTFNFTEANGEVISMGAVNVLSGLPLIFARVYYH